MHARAPLPQAAQELLVKLQNGDRLTETNAYPGEFAFSHFARVFFNNAEHVARLDGWDDYAVFGALYQIRHGVELWLKCVIRDARTDAFLNDAFDLVDEWPLEELVVKASKGRDEPKKVALAIRRALCALRNRLVDNIQAPACFTRRMESHWAEKGLQYLREHPQTPRHDFAILHHPPVGTHNLADLWQEAKPHFNEASARLRTFSIQVDVKEHVEPEAIGSLCGLFAHFDPDGDAFRYPAALNGDWRVGLPHFSLDQLAELSHDLNWTVNAHEALRHDRYEFATVRTPQPSW